MQRIAVTGAAGQLGRELLRAFSAAGANVLGLARPDFDITSAEHLGRLAEWRPDVVVNAAAWTDVDGCARDPQRAMRINGAAAGAVAEAAALAGALIVQVSTNEVFDGTLDRPYTEDDEPSPINPYGASKLAGEARVAAASQHHLIVRTAWLYGGARSFPTKIEAAHERARNEGVPLRVVADEWGNPTSSSWLAAVIASLSLRPVGSVPSVLHAAGAPPATRYDWARRLLGPEARIQPVALADFPRASRVPQRAVLDASRLVSLGFPLHDWRAARGEERKYDGPR